MKMLINGKKVDSLDGKVMEIKNSFTHEIIDTVPVATKGDVDLALEASQKGKAIWANTPVYRRAEILLKYADLLSKNKEELATLTSKEMGKPIAQSEVEVDTMVRLYTGYVEKIKHFYGHTLPTTTQPGFENDIIFTRHEPLGVIACFVPFNFPMELYAQKVAPALAAGNAVIIKPSSDSPLAAIRLTELLHEAGVPGSVAQIVTGRGSTIGAWLTTSPKINAVSLTGSTEVGIGIAEDAAKNLHRVFLELGGNDPCIIFNDVDIEMAANEALAGRIINAGQTCCSAKRFIVHNSIKEEFTATLISKLEKLKAGDPLDRDTDVGPLVSENAAKDVLSQVELTIKQGAKCLYGGKCHNKTLVEPIVLTDVTNQMDIAKDLEVFGPVFPIIGFDTLDEAVKIANASQYGLNGGVISNDINKAMQVALRLECGVTVINGSGCYRTDDIAFGGYKMSGLGREGMSYTLEEMTQIKTVAMKNVIANKTK